MKQTYQLLGIVGLFILILFGYLLYKESNNIRNEVVIQKKHCKKNFLGECEGGDGNHDEGEDGGGFHEDIRI